MPFDIVRAEVSEFSSEFQSLPHKGRASDNRLALNTIVGVLRTRERIVNSIVKALKVLIPRGSHISGGVLQANSHYFLCMQQDHVQRRVITCLSSTYHLILIRARQQVPRDASTAPFCLHWTT